MHWKAPTSISAETFMFPNFRNFFNQILSAQKQIRTSIFDRPQTLKAVGINDFLRIDVPAREMLLSPILPERSLAMLYAPRGIGKSWLSYPSGWLLPLVSRCFDGMSQNKDASCMWTAKCHLSRCKSDCGQLQEVWPMISQTKDSECWQQTKLKQVSSLAQKKDSGR
jgi:hypothetical protein